MPAKKQSLLLLVFFYWVGLFSSIGGAGVYEAWVARYNGPVNGTDFARGLALDSSGSVYVTGFSRRGDFTFDYLTVKYSPSGETVWTRTYSGPSNDLDAAEALVLDDNGNLYVTGHSTGLGSSFDYSTIKYSPAGDTFWVRRYDGPGSSFDYATFILVDDSGQVYVTGHSLGSETLYDFATIKYAPSGETLWVRRYNGSGNGDDQASALSIDDSGNVYVTGSSWEGSVRSDFCTIKYSSAGETLWVRKYNGAGNGDDRATAIKVDSSGQVHVTGSNWNGSSFDITTIKYSPSGDTLWVRIFNDSADLDEQASALALDDSGNVYVTGTKQGAFGNNDYLLLKYSPSGNLVWLRSYNGPADSEDVPQALAIDPGGNVYVTGYSEGGSSSSDYATVKYSPLGQLLWVKRYNGPGNAVDEAYALALDTSGNLYVTGRSFGTNTSYDFTTIKYSPCDSASPLAGDANAGGTITLSDIIAAINYIFNKPGCSPLPLCWLSGQSCRGDWNGDKSVTLSDVIWGVNYIFNKPGGPWSPVASGVCCPATP